MSFDDAIAAFDLYLRAERNVSPHTRRAYVSDVRQLAEFVDAGDSPAAVTPPLVRALSLAEPGGYVRTFADEGAPMAQLLTLVKARGMAPEGYVDKLLAAIGVEELPGQPAARRLQASTFPLIEPLSERELEVLSLVAAGLSNQEIAAKLVIAEGTVKKHLHNIFGKLNVRSRTQAVMRAPELGLL